MGHKFPIEHCARLESPERLALLPIARVVELAGARPGDRVLDVGCGPGVFTVPLAELVGHNGRVLAVDLHPEMVETCRERVRKAGLANVETALSSENTVPAPAGSIDLVFACQLLHELHDPPLFFAEMRRVLAPGGRLAAIDWEAVETGIGPPVDKRFTPAQSRRMLEENGFTIDAQESVTWANYLLLARAADSARP
jgi:ubiquinone/menaquinone biosynthesis C-methylase UbiE